MRRLLCISYRFPPETYPLASRVLHMLEYLEATWSIEAVTAAKQAKVGKNIRIHRVKSKTPSGLIRWLRRRKLGKFINIFFWPDQHVFWILPAYRKALQRIKEERPDLIVLFMMPYSSGLIGLMLKWRTGIPLVFNLNDSPTCADMHPRFSSWIHYRLSVWLENTFIRVADSVIYVSQRNLERVQRRQHESNRGKCVLIRRGASRPLAQPAQANSTDFRILYVGGMSGWHHLAKNRETLSKRLYRWWERVGSFDLARLEYSSHSPVYLGKAVQQLVENGVVQEGRVSIEVIGNSYPRRVIDDVLQDFDLEKIVQVHPPVPHGKVMEHLLRADLLFLALPDRLSGVPGGRISVKTYEYLMTNKPILAAIPEGENKEYLHGRDGVFIVQPRDIEAMREVIKTLALKKHRGESLHIDRYEEQKSLTYETRAHAFKVVLDEVLNP